MSSRLLVESWRSFLSEGREEDTIPKIGVVTTTKNPSNLNEWLSYHKNAGVDKILLFFDDIDNDIGNVRISHMHEGVHTFKSNKSVKGTHYNRQIANCQRGINILTEMGCKWVFHIDDDELIYSKSKEKIGESITRELIASDTHAIRLQNYENLRMNREYKNYNYFKDENVFVERGLYAYGGIEVGGGKTEMNTDYSHFLYPDGVHFFKHMTESINNHISKDLIILHYPHNVYERFIDKCSTRGNTTCPWGVYKKIYEMVRDGKPDKELKETYRKNIIYNSDRIQELSKLGREIFKFEMEDQLFINS